MKGFKKFVCLIFLSVQITYVFCDEPVCPSLKIPDDMTNPFVAQSYKRNLTHDIWKSPGLSTPTELVAQLRDLILDMSDSDSFYFTEVAFQFTGWAACFLAEVDHVYPSFCLFASAINNSAEWCATGDNKYYIEALNNTIDAVPYALDSLVFASLDDLQCKNNTAPPAKSPGCYQNGLVSNQEAVWNVYGRLLPWPLRSIAELLQASPLFSDRAFATILAFIITPVQYFYFTNQPYPLLIEIGKYYTNAADNSKCCCGDWDTHMTAINGILYETAVENAAKKIDELLHEC